MKTILNIMWVVALLIWAACFAMGFNYQGASLVVSIVLLVAVFAIMALDIFMLNKWADPEGGTDRSKAHAKEIACFVVYVVMLVLTASGFAHFITVQTEVKSEVRPLAKERIRELRIMFGNENKDGSYWAYVTEKSETYRNMQRKNNTDVSTVNTRVAQFEDDMMGNGDFEQMRSKANSFLKECENSVDNWIPWNVVEYLGKLDENTEEWYNSLRNLSDKTDWVRETGEHYESPVKNNESLATKVLKPEVGDFGLLSIVLIVVLQIIVLLTYLKTKDWSRRGPIKTSGMRVYNSGTKDSKLKDTKDKENDDNFLERF